MKCRPRIFIRLLVGVWGPALQSCISFVVDQAGEKQGLSSKHFPIMQAYFLCVSVNPSGVFIGSAARKPESKTFLQREIEATDRQIDQLVYELYGLTEKDIKIVEGES